MMDLDEQKGREALDLLRGGAPDPAFRARTRTSFLEAAAVQAVKRPVSARPSAYRRALYALASAAAVLLVVGIAVVLNPGPRWRVASSQNASGNVLVDDNPIPVDDVRSLNEALVPGSTIEWDGVGDIELVSRRFLALGIAPGTKMTLPAPPPRWFARSVRGTIQSGTVRLTSGPRFHGARVTIEAPQATAEMTGTTLAVIAEPQVTCVCVLEGAVHVMAGKHDMGMVPAGMRATVFGNGDAPIQAAMRPTERVKLSAMKEAVKPDLERGGD
jgi:hypothetical protein